MRITLSQRWLNLLLVLFIAVGVYGCRKDSPKAEYERGPASVESADDSKYAVVRVYYGTDRRETGKLDPAERFSGERGYLSYGSCTVSIPASHRRGNLESPNILKFEFREDPAKHIVLLTVVPQPEEVYFTTLNHRLAASGRRDAFIFIHGFNVSFEDAARRTAQMAYDLEFDGLAMFYSWPSVNKSSATGYTTDEQNIVWATPHIRQFIQDVHEKTDADTIHLIGHSMGTRGLTAALADWPAHAADGPTFKHIILAAPDIDAEVFKRDIAPKVHTRAQRVTMYASSRDVPLSLSKFVHSYPRAGDTTDSVCICPGIDTIDASALITDFWGHSYYGNNRSIISDMYYLIRDDAGPGDRYGLNGVPRDKPTYWRFAE